MAYRYRKDTKRGHYWREPRVFDRVCTMSESEWSTPYYEVCRFVKIPHWLERMRGRHFWQPSQEE